MSHTGAGLGCLGALRWAADFRAHEIAAGLGGCFWMAMFPALWKFWRSYAAFAAALVSRAWERALSACRGGGGSRADMKQRATVLNTGTAISVVRLRVAA